MLNSTDSIEKDNKIDNLIDDFQHFKKRMKIKDLDLEKKILTLENVFDKIEKNVEIIKNIEDIDALKDLKKAKETLLTLEDLTLADRLDIIENKETAKNISEKLRVFNTKIELMSNALKIFDDKIKNVYESKTNIPENTDFISLVEELSKLKDTIGTFEKNNPITQKEFKTLQNGFNNVNKDFATLISGVREEMEQYDTKIRHLIDEIQCLKDMDSDIGKNENKYLGLLNLIKKIHETAKEHTSKINANDVRIKDLEINLNNTIESHINKLSEKIETKIKNIKPTQENTQLDSSFTPKIQNNNDNNNTDNIDAKLIELNNTISIITNQIEDEKKYTNEKISNAMDAFKTLMNSNKINLDDVRLDNANIDEIKKEINSLKKEYTLTLNSKINNIENANNDIKNFTDELQKHILELKTTIQNKNETEKSQTDINSNLKSRVETIENHLKETIKTITDVMDEFEKNKKEFETKIIEQFNKIDIKEINIKFDTIDTKIKEIEENNTKKIDTLKEEYKTKLDSKIDIKENDTKFNTIDTKIKAVEENNKKIVENIIKSVDNIKTLKTTMITIENNTKDEINDLKKIISENQNKTDINELKEGIATKTKDSEIQLKTIRTDIKNKIKIQEKHIKDMIEVLNKKEITKNEQDIKNTDNQKIEIQQLTDKTEANLEQIETKLNENINKLKKDISQTNNSEIKNIQQNINKQIKDQEIELKNLIETLNKTETTEMKNNLKTEETMKKELEKIKNNTKLELNTIKQDLNINLKQIKNDILNTYNSEIKDLKIDTKKLNNIQTKINKMVNEKINHIETNLFNNQMHDTSNETETKNLLHIITLLKAENKMLSKEIKNINERLNSIEHSGPTETAPLVLE